VAATTSLLKGAQALRKKVQAQEDAEMAFAWESSAQTYEDFAVYAKYIENRQSTSSDPSQQLSYERTLRSARRSYVSNEIQRVQMAIMEGRAGTEDKMNAVRDLYFQAVDNQDLNLAQNLLSQFDSLSIKLQNERETAARQFASSSAKVKSDLFNNLEKGVNDITLPTGQTVTPLKALSKALQETGDTVAIMQAAEETLTAMRAVIIDQYQTATTQEEVDKLEQKYGAGLADIDSTLKVNLGGMNLTAQDVVNAIANDQMNNPKYSLKAVYNEATGKNEFKLKENAVEQLDYVRQFDPATGEEYFVPATIRTDQDKLFFGTSDQGRGLNTQITNTGLVIGGGTKEGDINLGTGTAKRDDSQSIGNRLKNLGIIARQNGTTLLIKLPGESVERQATIQPDGSLRFYGDDGQLKELGIVDRNLGTNSLPQQFKAGEVRTVAPDEISDFGSQSTFGGRLSEASPQGQRYLSDITGQTEAPTDIVRGAIRLGNDFSGRGTAVRAANLQGGTSSALLQNASTVRAELQAEQRRQQMIQAQAEMSARLQASNTFNINQTPVQQFASNGVLRRQLSVARPTPTPRVVVAPPPPTPQISRVTVATPGRISGVGVAQPTARLTVR